MTCGFLLDECMLPAVVSKPARSRIFAWQRRRSVSHRSVEFCDSYTSSNTSCGASPSLSPASSAFTKQQSQGLRFESEGQDSQSKPKHDLSPCSAPPVSVSLRVRDSISWHIFPTIRFSFWEKCTRGNGSFRMEGKFCARVMKVYEILVDELKAFRTCTTSELFPWSAPKSWDRAAIPTLSSLRGEICMSQQSGI
jgi:hypothetical protein